MIQDLFNQYDKPEFQLFKQVAEYAASLGYQSNLQTNYGGCLTSDESHGPLIEASLNIQHPDLFRAFLYGHSIEDEDEPPGPMPDPTEYKVHAAPFLLILSNENEKSSPPIGNRSQASFRTLDEAKARIAEWLEYVESKRGKPYVVTREELADPELQSRLLERYKRPGIQEPPSVQMRAVSFPGLEAPEVVVLSEAVSNWSNQSQWSTDGLEAVFHSQTRHGHSLRHEFERPSEFNDLTSEEEAEKAAELVKGALERVILSRDDAFTVQYVIFQLVSSTDGVTNIGFAELLDLNGKTRAGKDARMAEAQRLADVFRLLSRFKVCGTRTWKDQKTGKNQPIVSNAPILNFEGSFYPSRTLPGMRSPHKTPPLGFTFTDSTITKEFRKDPSLCCYLGNLVSVAKIPSGKPSGDWAKSISLAIAELARVNAKNGGSQLNLSRGTLLLRFQPIKDPVEILESSDPGRAKTYFIEAMKYLRTTGMIESWTEPQANTNRKSWTRIWLDETVEITLAGTWASQASSIQANYAKRKSLRDGKKASKNCGNPS